MAAILGKNIILKISSVSGSSISPIVIGCARSCTLDISTEMLESSNTEAGFWASFVAAKNSFTVSSDNIAYYDAAKFDTEDLLDAQINRKLLGFQFSITDGTTTKTVSGSAYITSSSITGADNEIGTFSVQLQGTGALTVS